MPHKLSTMTAINQDYFLSDFPPENVLLNHPVVKIDQTGTDITVSTMGGKIFKVNLNTLRAKERDSRG